MKILAIDIGSSHIKAIALDSRFKHYDIISHHTIEVPDFLEAKDDSKSPSHLSQGQKQALYQLQQHYSHHTYRIVVNIPDSLYTSRTLSFPFKSPKKILANTKFQIEDEVPFHLDKSLLVNQIFPSKDKTARSICCVAPKLGLEDFIKEVQGALGIDIDVLTSTKSSFINFLYNQKSLYENKGIAFIDFGHEQSSIHIFDNCMLEMYRTTTIGGKHITTTISNHYNISMEEAEMAKQNNGFLGSTEAELSKEQENLSKIIADTLEPVLKDFYQCTMAYFSKYHKRVSQIYLIGGTSLFPGISTYLSDQWKIPVTPFNIFSQLPNLSIRLSEKSCLPLTESIILGLTQVERRHKKALNFRAHMFRSNKTVFNFKMEGLANYIRVFSIVYVFAILVFGIEGFLLKKEIAKYTVKRDAVIRKIFGRPKPSLLYTLKNNPSRLKRLVDEKIAGLEGVKIETKKENKNTFLKVIKEISQSIPSNIVMEIKKITILPESMKITFESSSNKNIGKIIDYIKKNSFVKTVSKPIMQNAGSKYKTAYIEIERKSI